MKVFIGPYRYLMDEERQVDVEIHDYDMWSLDHTLAKIIYPALLKFRSNLQSYPTVDDVDVPDGETLNGAYNHETQGFLNNLLNGEAGQEEADIAYARWLYVLDEMIFSFHCLHTDNAWEDEYFRNGATDAEYVAMEERISNGFRLFGKYYRSLWN